MLELFREAFVNLSMNKSRWRAVQALRGMRWGKSRMGHLPRRAVLEVVEWRNHPADLRLFLYPLPLEQNGGRDLIYSDSEQKHAEVGLPGRTRVLAGFGGEGWRR